MVQVKGDLPGDPVDGGVMALEPGNAQDNSLDRQGVDEKGDIFGVIVIKCHLDRELLVSHLP